jgi:hypothetical protein
MNESEDDLRARHGLLRRGAEAAAVLLRPGLGLGGGAVVGGDGVPGARQVASHRMAHDAQAQKGDAARGCRFVGAGAHVWCP